jgi:protein CpxP
MRIFFPSLALGVAMLAGVSGTTLLAQDQSQPAAGQTSAASSAPTQPRHAVNPRHQAKKMARKLGLTADQESKLEPIFADRAQQMQAVRADSTLSPQDMRVRVRSIRQDSEAKMEALLTDTQKQQWEQMKASHKAKRLQQSSAANS